MTILAACPNCGEVALTACEIDLHLPVAADVPGRYGFTCPACHGYVRKDADPHIAALLLAGGVIVTATPATLTGDDLTRLRQALLLVDELSPIALEEMSH